MSLSNACVYIYQIRKALEGIQGRVEARASSGTFFDTKISQGQLGSKGFLTFPSGMHSLGNLVTNTLTRKSLLLSN